MADRDYHKNHLLKKLYRQPPKRAFYLSILMYIHFLVRALIYPSSQGFSKNFSNLINVQTGGLQFMVDYIFPHGATKIVLFQKKAIFYKAY